MSCRAHLVLSGFLLVLGTSSIAPLWADPITVRFTAIPAPGDPVNTSSSTGFFTFDSSLIPAGGGLVFDRVALPIEDFGFAWGHTLWTTTNAGVAKLLFSASGELTGFFAGGKPAGIGGLRTDPVSQVIDDFVAIDFSGSFDLFTRQFDYTNAGSGEIFRGQITSFGSSAPTPEPSTIVLLSTAAALLGLLMWRSKPASFGLNSSIGVRA
jgi:hypothetical protein